MQQPLLASAISQTDISNYSQNENLELRGIYEAKDLLMLSIHNTETRRTRWHKISKSQTGMHIHSVTNSEITISTQDGSSISIPIYKSDGIPMTVPESFAHGINPSTPQAETFSSSSRNSTQPHAGTTATEGSNANNVSGNLTVDSHTHASHNPTNVATYSAPTGSTSQQDGSEDSLAAIRARMANSKHQITPKVRDNNVTGAPDPELTF